MATRTMIDSGAVYEVRPRQKCREGGRRRDDTKLDPPPPSWKCAHCTYFNGLVALGRGADACAVCLEPWDARSGPGGASIDPARGAPRPAGSDFDVGVRAGGGALEPAARRSSSGTFVNWEDLRDVLLRVERESLVESGVNVVGCVSEKTERESLDESWGNLSLKFEPL